MAWMCAQSLQSCPPLCDPMDHGPPGSSVHRILQARILEWVASSFSSDQVSSELSEWSEVAQSCLTLFDPVGCSLPGSSVSGIFQARVLEWVAISFSESYGSPHIFFIICVSCLEGRLHEGYNFCFCSLLCPQSLGECLAWKKHSIMVE